MSVFWLHLRNSPIRWGLPALIALSLGVLFFRSRFWIGVWPETGAAAQVGTYFLGAVGAGAAAWAAGAPGRHRVVEQIAAARVHPVTTEAYRLAATVVVVLIPYLTGHAVAFAFTAPASPPGWHLWLGYFALGLVAMLLATAWGWMLGKVLGSVFAALGAVVGWLVLVVVAEDYLGLVLTALRGPPERIVDPAAVTIRLVVVVALLATLPLLGMLGRLRQHAWRIAAPAVAALGLLFTLAGTTVIVEREPIGDEALCVSGERTQLCVWPEHEKYIPLLQEVNDRIDALPEVLVVPARMNESGVVRTRYVDSEGVIRPTPGDHPPVFHIIEGSPWSYTGAIQSAILSATWDGCDWNAMSEADRRRLHVLDAWLRAYLAGGGSPDYSSSAPADVAEAWAEGRSLVDELPNAEQFAWAEREVDEMLDHYCPSAD
ncbi:hypothetical protein JQS43_00960 [Natronosporangium hydrolyticum]|uniref:Uncharacterized protein n=1 Tax=Natronosporangium hydrolyticum TaxID=2811111 RepID=A0A895YI10_9ACTN|nr:hypothetical protein [Natronosporangium hydrolyticum]QSB14993.1 hypothetical protein JQS43_00960 [Natronosporangium hydrolyticum]